MLACSNVRIIEECYIPVTHLMLVLGVFYRFKNPYKCCEVMASFVPLVDLEFLKSIYGSVPSIPCLFNCS